ncbi:S-adenosyl-L-methionine dependent methyltransferase [Cubamyces sp. BRFM 1775]|nr:S-adenosyl-L-methionine dependent methyltransferase [Cubamyces sp. BRFM 1775]
MRRYTTQSLENPHSSISLKHIAAVVGPSPTDHPASTAVYIFTRMDPSATIYTKLMLRVYDFIVLNLSNRFAWRCSTPNTLIPFYQKHLGEHAHLEAGVGTGYYPAASVDKLSKTKLVTLLDLNPNTLAMAETRLSAAGYRGTIEAFERSIFDPLPESTHEKYDSVALYYIFHCLPGTFPEKADKVFQTVIPALAPGGVVFGSTILGKECDHNTLSRTMVKLYNEKGMFGNRDDTEADLRKSLEDNFHEYDLRVEGIVAIFSARNPKKQKE